MTQTTIPSVGTTVLTTIGSRISKMFSLPLSNSRSSSPAPPKSKLGGVSEESETEGEMMDLGEGEEKRKGAVGDSRAERR